MSEHPIRAALRAALPAAMRARDRPTVTALRSALGAIDNAEAVPTPTHLRPAETPGPAPTVQDGPIAGGTLGLGAGETARRALGEDEVRAIVQVEVDERLVAATEYDAAGRTERAELLRAEAAALAPFVAT